MTSVPHKEEAAPSVPGNAGTLCLLAVLSAAALVFDAFHVGNIVRRAAIGEGAYGSWLEAVIWLAIVLAAGLFWPAFKSVTSWQRGREKLQSGNLVEARIGLAAGREWAFITLGYAAAYLVGLSAIAFVLANDMSVGRTFIYLPLMAEKWTLVVRAFWNNVFIFLVAEVLVLAWGLVVAIARLMPGEAGRPVRMLAAFYCDIFRGLPAVVTLYLVGFGLPLSGVIPSELPGIGKIPLSWYAIIALTLTYGAYVAEVYRGGIESIHWSQIAAARSLGLSYIQALRHVIVPQAMRRITAPLLNDFISLQKDTALVNVIGVIDGFNQARIIASNAFNLSAVTILAIIFVVITIPQTRLVDKLIERDQKRMRGGG
ncbi:MAG TPA: amino acid ABC transporter permease [Aestuariivirgaceae bacterium]|nr:amino acid ABC transporter permease [Aestuariivirgaceae bacterium]